MNKDQAEGMWEQVKVRAKRAWGELTDDEALKAEGSVDKLYGVIQERVGDTREAIREKLHAGEDQVDDVKRTLREQLADGDHGDGKWLKAKGRAKRAWGELTDDDALKAEGAADHLHGVIKAGVSDAKDVARSAIDRVKPD